MRRAQRGPPRYVAVRNTAIAAALVLGTLAGCGSPHAVASAPVPSAPTARPAGAGSDSTQSMSMIHLGSFAYAVPASVAPGSTVGVMNMDGEAHTVTADNGAFDVKAPAGTTVTFSAPTKPGRYSFHCTFHSTMHGVLVVR